MSIPLPEPLAEGPTMPVPQPRSELEAVVLVIERMARDPATEMAKVPPLLDLMQTLMRERSRRAYNTALAKLQGELEPVLKRGKIKISKDAKAQPYALLEDVIAELKPKLAKHGFSVQFETLDIDADTVAITTILRHDDGHDWMTTKKYPIDRSGSKNPTQAHGSTVAYGRRYGLMVAFNLATEGEDVDAGAPEPSVTQEQAEEIRALVKAGGDTIDEATALAYLKVSNWGELPAKKFDNVIRELKRKAGK